ncbi:MAG: phospho-sugar mutase [Pirellulales bacterium]|nr:phospho-sugar mutase [Pirellulales bacterium]
MTAQETVQDCLASLDAAQADGRVSTSAAENIRTWLTEDRYADYREAVAQHIAEQKWQQLDDVFWTIIPFGTGGRRGRMYPIGCNAINDRTIGESAQGLADYVVQYHDGQKELSCAIAYDTRHQSRHFTELCAGIMVAAGFTVYLLDDYRATPQLSYTVRRMKCDCGIMVTASHNPPSDNAVKVYWSSGAQVLPPHDKEIIQRVMSCQEIRSVPFETAVAKGRIKVVTDEIDAAYVDEAAACGFPGPRQAKILYSPLHGVGAAAVLPLLARDGFEDVQLYGPHAEPSGDFPNVPGHVSNPENAAIFDAPIETAREIGADLILATDPDCDRIGCAAPKTADPNGPWGTFNGNQIGAILAEYILTQRAAAGTLSAGDYVVKTLVTTELIRHIAADHGVDCQGELLVGFKHIAEVIDRQGPDQFLYGTEESHGYLVGQYCRDKDGAVACMLMSELAARLKSEGRSMHDYLADLQRKHGYHKESLINLFMEGSEGMAAMQRLMQAFRSNPPQTLAGIPVAQIRDYQSQTVTQIDSGNRQPLSGPLGNLIIMDLAEPGNYVAARPSGTEPKIKLYVFTRASQAESSDLDAAETMLTQRIAKLDQDIREFAKLNS